MHDSSTRQNEVITRYGSAPEKLDAVLSGLSEQDLDRALRPDSWTIRQIVHHLADGDDIWKIFIKMALGSTHGDFSLKWYWDIPQDEWVKHWAYASRDIRPSLALLKASRAQVVQMVNAVPGALDRTLLVCWPKGDGMDMSIADVMEMQTRHIEGHLEEIQKIVS